MPLFLRLLRFAASLGALFALHEPGAAQGCAHFDDFRNQVASEQSSTGRRTLVDSYLECVRTEGAPKIEPTGREGWFRAVFLFRGEAESLVLAGDMNGWDRTSDPMEQLEGTDLFFKVLEFPAGSRLDYKFVRDREEWLLDPLNPRTLRGGYGPNSHFWLPGYIPPEGVEPDPAIPHGTIKKHPFPSPVKGKRRIVQVYLPPGYEAETTLRYPVLYLLDGEDYVELGAINNIVDCGLSREKMRPVILVLVPPLQRVKEYETEFPAFEKYLVKELIPFIDSRYRTLALPASRGIMGVSLGGFASLNLISRNPKVFSRCGAQSTGNGDPRRFRALLARIDRLETKNLVFHLDVGVFEERLHGSDLLAMSRDVKRALDKRGAKVQYLEVAEGHSWGSWRARAVSALAFFWPASRVR